jgi:hypothetical protein
MTAIPSYFNVPFHFSPCRFITEFSRKTSCIKGMSTYHTFRVCHSQHWRSQEHYAVKVFAGIAFNIIDEDILQCMTIYTLLPLAMFYSESEFAQDLQANTIIIVTAWKMAGKINAECQAVELKTIHWRTISIRWLLRRLRINYISMGV